MAAVLIVDDSRTSRKMMRNMVEAAGFTVADEAVNGQEGIDKYKELKPDLVTMDITMPVLDGVESMKGILEFDPKAKVVMVTAVGQQNKVIQCIKDGAFDYITKPYEQAQVEKQDIVVKVFCVSPCRN